MLLLIVIEKYQAYAGTGSTAGPGFRGGRIVVACPKYRPGNPARPDRAGRTGSLFFMNKSHFLVGEGA